jgi:cell division protein FtsI (penicillin-binding protein 3)
MQAAAIRNRNRNTIPRAIPLRMARFWLICLFFLAWAITISSRLFWLQIMRHQEYVDRAEKQQQRTFEVCFTTGICTNWR